MFTSIAPFAEAEQAYRRDQIFALYARTPRRHVRHLPVLRRRHAASS